MDGLLTAGRPRAAGALAIVRAVTTPAHTPGMEVTGEEIESAEQLASMHAVCCDRDQGYFFARPGRADMMNGLIGDNWEAQRQSA